MFLDYYTVCLKQSVRRVRSYEDKIALSEAELTAVQQYEATVLWTPESPLWLTCYSSPDGLCLV